MRPGVLVGGLGMVGVALIGATAIYLWPTSGPAPPAPQVATKAAAPQGSPVVAPAALPSQTGPDFDVVRVRPDGQAVIAGRADPGARVSVLDGATVVATATADAHGEWVALPDKALSPGSHELSLAEASPGGGPDQKSANVVVVSVPEAKKTPAGESAQPLAVLVPRQGEGAAKALQTPGAPT